MNFFETSTRNLLAYEAAAGVGHHVALSVVGSDGLSGGIPGPEICRFVGKDRRDGPATGPECGSIASLSTQTVSQS